MNNQLSKVLSIVGVIIAGDILIRKEESLPVKLFGNKETTYADQTAIPEYNNTAPPVYDAEYEAPRPRTTVEKVADVVKGASDIFKKKQPTIDISTNTSYPIQRGSRGEVVRILQQHLSVSADGVFGSDTETALYQRYNISTIDRPEVLQRILGVNKFDDIQTQQSKGYQQPDLKNKFIALSSELFKLRYTQKSVKGKTRNSVAKKMWVKKVYSRPAAWNMLKPHVKSKAAMLMIQGYYAQLGRRLGVPADLKKDFSL